MTVPVQYILKDMGAYWSADSAGPYGCNGAGVMQPMWDAGNLRSGELPQVNRMAGGAICGYGTPITATGTFVVAPAGKLIYGFLVVTGTATGTLTVYDDVSAVAANMMLNAASVAANNTWIPIGAPGMGLLFTRGITAVVAVAFTGILIPVYQA
jgi:hypothetical protein